MLDLERPDEDWGESREDSAIENRRRCALPNSSLVGEVCAAGSPMSLATIPCPARRALMARRVRSRSIGFWGEAGRTSRVDRVSPLLPEALERVLR